MKLREALFNYYHIYKNTSFINSTFNMISYLSDMCTDNLKNKADLLVYTNLLKKLDIYQIFITHGQSDGFIYIKKELIYKSLIEKRINKYMIFYTYHMMDGIYNESLDEPLKDDNIKISKKPHSINNHYKKDETIKKKTLIKPKTLVINKSKIYLNQPVFYNTRSKKYHFDPACYKISHSKPSKVDLIANLPSNYKPCPVCNNKKCKLLHASAIGLNSALANALIINDLFDTEIYKDFNILLDKLKQAGPRKEVTFHHFKFKYYRVLTFVVKVEISY